MSGKGAHVTNTAMVRRHGFGIGAMDRVGLGTSLRFCVAVSQRRRSEQLYEDAEQENPHTPCMEFIVSLLCGLSVRVRLMRWLSGGRRWSGRHACAKGAVCLPQGQPDVSLWRSSQHPSSQHPHTLLLLPVGSCPDTVDRRIAPPPTAPERGMKSSLHTAPPCPETLSRLPPGRSSPCCQLFASWPCPCKAWRLPERASRRGPLIWAISRWSAWGKHRLP
jgi:hypothetical protein